MDHGADNKAVLLNFDSFIQKEPLLRILVCDMVAMLLSLFSNIKNSLVAIYSQKLNMFDWQNFFTNLKSNSKQI